MRLSAGILVKLVIFVTLLFGVVSTETVAAEGLAGTEIESVEVAYGHDKVGAWNDFSKAAKNFSKTNPAVLEKYLKLSEKNRALILKFSDNADNSTLAKFLDDTDDPDFLAFINKAENENIMKSFVSHKQGVDLDNITDEIAEKLVDDIDDLPGSIGEKARKWNKRSSEIASNNTKFAKARKFEKTNSELIRNNSNPPCSAWGGNGDRFVLDQLHVRAKGSTKRVVFDDALIDPKIYTDQATLQKYRKVIYHDSKLSSSAPWSTNQNTDIVQVFRDNPNKKFIELNVRSSSKYFGDYPNSPIGFNDKLRIYREDVYKSISNGDGGDIIDVVNMNSKKFID